MFSFQAECLTRILETKCHISAKIYLCILFQSKELKSQISIRKIASYCSISEVTAIKALRELRRLNLISVKPQRNPNRANIYELVGIKKSTDRTLPEPLPDAFREWLRIGLTPDVYRKVRELYGLGMSQENLRTYFDKYVDR